MPRQPRIDAPGLLYHVMARGIERRQIFKDDKDRQIFTSMLGKLVLDTGTPLYAFSLIPNHFHLLLRRSQIPISRFMQRLLTTYASYFNKRHKRSGHLFQNRYKSIICEESAYFLELVRYINLNPLRAGLVENFEDLSDFQYCAHAYLLGIRGAEWFDPAPVLALFGSEPVASRQVYNRFVAEGQAQVREDLVGGGLKRSLGLSRERPLQPERPQAYDSRVLGLGEFVESLIGSSVKGEEKERSADALVEKTCAEVCLNFSVTKAELMGKGRNRRVSLARAILALKLSKGLGLPNSEIARVLSVSQVAVHKMLSEPSRAEQANNARV